MDTPIKMPFLERRRDNLQITRPPQPNGATTFAARSFVKLSGTAPDQVLVPCVSGDVVCYGWCPDRSHASTETPPDALYRDTDPTPFVAGTTFNYLHWPLVLQDSIFIMNITNATGLIGQVAGGPQLSAVTVGQLCFMRVVTIGGVAYQLLDVATATTPFAKIVGIPPGQSLNDYNGFVYAEILAAVIEAGAGS